MLKNDGVPLYYQLREIFTEKIASGEWKTGDIIPNEQELCKQYGVSRGPVRQALGLLVRDGLLTRKQGKGTEVQAPKIERDISAFYSFTMLIQRLGMEPSMRLLGFETIEATGSVARWLELEPGTAVFKIHRLRLADNEPFILENVFMPVHLCPELSEAEILSAPLYEILPEKYGVYLAQSKQYFEPSVTDQYEAEVLEIEERVPIFLLQNITYALDKRPVVFSKAVMRGERIRYSVELNNPEPTGGAVSLTISDPQSLTT